MSGYKLTMVHEILELYDNPTEFADAREMGKLQKRGQRGLKFGAKAHLLDAMEIISKVWDASNPNSNRCSQTTVARCWRKADIFDRVIQEQYWKTFGSLSNNNADRVKLLQELQAAVSLLSLKVQHCSSDPPACVKNSIVDQAYCTSENIGENDIRAGVDFWIGAEEDHNLQNMELEECIEKDDECIDEECTEATTGEVKDRHVSHSELLAALETITICGKSHSDKIQGQIASLCRLFVQERLQKKKKQTNLFDFHKSTEPIHEHPCILR